VTPTIFRHMFTLATELMPALATSRIMSASEARVVGAGAPVPARFNLAGGVPDTLDMLSTGSPPSAPPAGGAVEAPPAGAWRPGPGARGTADMAGAARAEERTGSGVARGQTVASTAQAVKRVA
jgi:hypothetical protein